jgi:VWFA-related protein
LVKIVAAILVLVLTANAQESEPTTTFRATTNLVTVQVTVTDTRGNPVTDLRGDSLQIFEDGEKEPEKIVYFQPVIAEVGGRISEVQSKGSSPSTTGQTPLAGIPLAILVMDALNTDPSDQMCARDSMAKALNSLPPDTAVAVMRLDRTLWLLQDFTRDSQLLREAVSRAVNTDSMTDLGAGALNKAPQPVSQTSGGQSSGKSTGISAVDLQAFVQGAHSASEKDFQSGMMDIRVEQTLASLEAIAKLVGRYRTRKNLIWVSGSFPLSIDADADAGDNRMKFAGIKDYTKQTEKTANILADANVAIYPIDARGLQAPKFCSAASTTDFSSALRPTSKNEFLDRVDSQATMSLLAGETGGRTCVDNNDLGGCLSTAVADGSTYYEIGYYPRNRNWDGKFRRIKIRTTLRHVNLRYRRGYFAGTQNEKPTPTHVQIFRDKYGRIGTLNWSQNRIEYRSQGLPVEDGARGFFDWVWGHKYQCSDGKLTPIVVPGDETTKSEATHQLFFANLRGDITVVELLGKQGVEYHGTLSIDESVLPFFQIVRILYLCQ